MDYLKTIKGVAGELIKYLHKHIQEDQAFFEEIKKIDKTKAEQLEAAFTRIHQKIQNDLDKALALSDNAKQSPKDINKIFPYLLSFQKLIFQQKTNLGKSEYEYLNELVAKEGPLHAIARKRMLVLYALSTDKRVIRIDLLMDKLSGIVRSHFKLKRNLINLRRPKVNEKFKIGHNNVHLEIYFDKDLSDRAIGNLLENYLNILPRVMETSDSPSVQKIKQRVEKKLITLQDQSLKTIEELWLYQLKRMFKDILEKNQDLILTPSFKYQVKIGPDHGAVAYCDGLTTIDNYLIGIEISTLIVTYLLGETFYDAFPASFFFQLKNAIASPLQKDQAVAAYSKDPLSVAITRIAIATQNYRTWSLYSVFAHETEHAFDRRFLFKKNKLKPLLYYLASSSGFYDKHKVIGANQSMIALTEFYLMIRAEAPTQFREFIVNHEATLEQNQTYSLVNPIPALASRNILNEMNAIIRKLENEGKNLNEKKIDISDLGYQFSHVMNMIIFFADCKRRNYDLVLLDSKSFKRFAELFPKLTPTLAGMAGLQNIEQGSPEWFLFDTIKNGTTEGFKQILARNGIPRLSLNDIASLIGNNIEFYMFKPPVPIMKQTLKKIEITDEMQYFELYKKACNDLGIPDEERLLSIKNIRAFAENMYEANAKLAKEKGFHY